MTPYALTEKLTVLSSANLAFGQITHMVLNTVTKFVIQPENTFKS